MEESFGKYTLLARLGSGGMAEVFLGRTQSLAGFEKLLAIKRLLPFCTEDEETVDLLADEARITVRLTHPNIVQVFDFGRVNERYFIAMEYVDGLDLKSLVRIDEVSSTPLDLKLALYITTCILEALDFAHTQHDGNHKPLGIIHRDVSPHNVLISRHGQVKLTDFGVARAAISCHVSRVGDIRGKFSYMPPEQVCGGDIDQRVDIFAAGAILYELLSGRQPYRSASVDEQLNLLRCDMRPPSTLRPQLPFGLDAICMRALDKDPANRYSSAAEFAAALREQHMLLDGAALPPTGELAQLVERRMGQAEVRPERTSLMGISDYSAADDSLIREPERLEPRQPRRSRELGTLSDGAGLLAVHTDPEAPPLLALPTDNENLALALNLGTPSASVGPVSDDTETVVAFRVPSELRSSMAPAEASPPTRQRTEELKTTVADIPFRGRHASLDHLACDPPAGGETRRPGDPPSDVPPASAPPRRRGWVQVMIVLVSSFVIGVGVAIALATC